jgi:hypothetical protein
VIFSASAADPKSGKDYAVQPYPHSAHHAPEIETGQTGAALSLRSPALNLSPPRNMARRVEFIRHPDRASAQILPSNAQ